MVELFGTSARGMLLRLPALPVLLLADLVRQLWQMALLALARVPLRRRPGTRG